MVLQTKRGKQQMEPSDAKRAELTREYQRALKDRALWEKEKIRSRMGPREKTKKDKELQAGIEAGKKRLNALDESEAANARRQRAVNERAAIGRELSKQGKPKPKPKAVPPAPQPQTFDNPLFEESHVYNKKPVVFDNPLLEANEPNVLNQKPPPDRLRLLKSAHGSEHPALNRLVSPTLANLPALPNSQAVAMRARRPVEKSLDNQIHDELDRLNLSALQEEENVGINNLRFRPPVLPKRRARPYFYEFGTTESPDNTGWNVEPPKAFESELPNAFRGHPLVDRVYMRQRHARITEENLPMASSDPTIPVIRKRHTVPSNLPPLQPNAGVPSLQDERLLQDVPPLANGAIPRTRKRRSSGNVEIELPNPDTFQIPILRQRLRQLPSLNSSEPPQLRKRWSRQEQPFDPVEQLLPNLSSRIVQPAILRRRGIMRHPALIGPSEELPTLSNGAQPILQRGIERHPALTGPSEELPNVSNGVQPAVLRRRRLPSARQSLQQLLPNLSSVQPASLRRRGSRQPMASPRVQVGDTTNTTPKRRLDRSLAFQKRTGPIGGKVSSGWTMPWSRKDGYTRIQNDNKKPEARGGWFGWVKKSPTEKEDDSIKEGPKSRWGGMLWSRTEATQPERTNLNTTPKRGLNRSLAFKRRNGRVDSNGGNGRRQQPDDSKGGGWFDKWAHGKKSTAPGGESRTKQDPTSRWTLPWSQGPRAEYGRPQGSGRDAGAFSQKSNNKNRRASSGWTAFSKDDKRSIYYGRAAKRAAQAMKNDESEYRRLLGGQYNRGSTNGRAKSPSGWTAFSKDDKRSMYYGQAAKQERGAKALQRRNGEYDQERQKRRAAEQLWEERKRQITLEQEQLERRKREAEQLWEERKKQIALEQERIGALKRAAADGGWNVHNGEMWRAALNEQQQKRRAADQLWEERKRQIAMEQERIDALKRAAAKGWRNVQYELNEQQQKRRAAEQLWEERKRQIAMEQERIDALQRAAAKGGKNGQYELNEERQKRRAAEQLWEERKRQIAMEQNRIARARARESQDRLNIQAPRIGEEFKKLANLKRNLRLEAVEKNLKEHQNKARDLEIVKQSFQALVERERAQIPRKRAGIAILDELLAKIT